MKKVGNLYKKAKKHFDELGFMGGLRWLLFAIRFRTIMFVTGKGAAKTNKEGNINEKKQKGDFLRKDSPDIYVFSMIPYYDIGGGQRPAQITKAMNLLGYRMHYIFGMHTSESVIFDMEIPTIIHRYINDYSDIDFENNIKKDDIVIVDFPYSKFIPYIEKAKKKGAKIVYENIDNWETSLGNNLFVKDDLYEVLKLADLLVGTASFLVDQLKSYCKELKIKKPIIYNPNAVNDTLFNPKQHFDKPEDFVAGEKTLIYYGSLWGDWFDWDLLYGIAKAFPNYSFLLIGEKENIRAITAKAPKNVHFLGIKHQSTLPAYLEYSDYAIIPFKVDKIGEAVSPLKIFEYISMNKYVMTTSMPEVTQYPNTFCGDTIKEWSAFLKKKNHKVDVSKRDLFIDDNNWFSRCNDILKVVGLGKKKFNKKISIIILNHNNRNCILECVDSVLRHSNGYNVEVIVVDNASTDDSVKILQKQFGKRIKIIKNSKNGCSSGRNLGVKESTGKYLMFLDSDQFVNHDNWMDSFVELLTSNNDVGAIGWAAGWIKKNKYGFSPTVDEYPYRSMPANMLARTDIDYLGSGGLFLNKKIFNEIGGFDEVFDPTCYEDTDFSYAIKNAGYKLMYSPYLGVIHVPHQTTNNKELSHETLIEKHRKKFIEKWKEKNSSLLKGNE